MLLGGKVTPIAQGQRDAVQKLHSFAGGFPESITPTGPMVRRGAYIGYGFYRLACWGSW